MQVSEVGWICIKAPASARVADFICVGGRLLRGEAEEPRRLCRSGLQGICSGTQEEMRAEWLQRFFLRILNVFQGWADLIFSGTNRKKNTWGGE